MKRYWKLVVLIPLIVLGIGTYYALASTMNQPDFYLKTQDGRTEVAASVQIHAQNGNIPERLSIGTSGSESPGSQSFWASLDSNYYSTNALKNLARLYPQFMRGKQNPNGFYVDDNVVGYANISTPNHQGYPYIRMEVSVYDKKQKESSSFTVTVPQKNVTQWVYLNDVNISGNTMRVFALTSDSSGESAVHLYTIDLNKKRLVSDHTLLNNQAVLGNVGDEGQLFDEPQSEYVAFQTIRNINTVGQEATSNSQKRQLYVYDIERGKLSAIRNPTLDNLLNNPPDGLQTTQQIGNQLYSITQINPMAPPVVVQYDLAAKKIRNQFTIKLKYWDMHDGMVSLAKIINHQLYLIATSPSQTTPTTLFIASLDTGKVLYEGIVARKDNKPVGNLQVYDVSVNGMN